MRTIKEVFGVDKPIIGMLHMTGYGRDRILENAKREIEIMYRNGVNAVLVENYFGDRVDVENALKYLQENYPNKVYGVNMLGFPEIAFDLARKYGARFVQLDSVCGHLEPSYEKPFLKKLETLRSDGDIFLLGGVRFKYQPVRSGRSLEEDLKLGMERCDAIVVTGEGTGISTDLKKIKTFRSILGDFPLIVGAGMTAETAQEQLIFSDGAIVGSYFKEFGEAEYPVDEERVKEFICKAGAGNGV
ncbi:MAG: membrane biogenesis protein [Oscillospiraceae bacterium]|nr:membrane biogenesis protein [Oscillospiraceae bacterium]